MSKKVSVITTTYNDCAHLQMIAAGVMSQEYQNIEYIIIDGGSKDGTLDFLKEFSKEFTSKGERSFYYQSEPDKGIYDAINKGIKAASGDIVGFMFDRFTSPQVLSRLVQAIEETGADGVHADLDYVSEDGQVVRKWRMGQGSLRAGWMPGHPTLYLKKEVYEKYGLYKTDYKIAADYEFIVRMLRDGSVRLAYVDEVLVHMFYGGTSTGGLKNYVNSFKESLRALRENQVSFAFIICVLRTFRVLFQFFH